MVYDVALRGVYEDEFHFVSDRQDFEELQMVVIALRASQHHVLGPYRVTAALIWVRNEETRTALHAYMVESLFVGRATSGSELRQAKAMMHVVQFHKKSADTSVYVTCIYTLKLRDTPVTMILWIV